jgi:Holliday junction resolvasome RuvABC endonuclease subunit
MGMKWLNEEKVNSVLGIDASTHSVAYCLNTPSGIKTYGEIMFSGETVFERLADAQKQIPQLLGHLDYDMILFESAVYIQNKRTVILLAYSFGAVLGALVKPGVAVHDISPLVWQPAIGNRALTKEEKIQIQLDHPGKSKSWYSNKQREFRKQRTKDWVTKNYGLQVATDNISDAIAISHVGVDTYC